MPGRCLWIERGARSKAFGRTEFRTGLPSSGEGTTRDSGERGRLAGLLLLLPGTAPDCYQYSPTSSSCFIMFHVVVLDVFDGSHSTLAVIIAWDLPRKSEKSVKVAVSMG